LRDKVGSDAAFAQEFYRAAAITLSSRLRRANDVQESRTQMIAEPEAWKRLQEALRPFKALLHEAGQVASKAEDVIPPSLEMGVREAFQGLVRLLNETLGDQTSAPSAVVEQLGLRAQQEFLPYMLLTENAARWYTKPRGYAGDFLSIEFIYEDEPRGKGALGRLLDRCFLDLKAAQAVRSRRPLICDLILEMAGQNGGSRPVNVTSLACGPAREVFDAIERIGTSGGLNVHLLDIDLQALAFVAERRDKLKLKKQIHLHNENLVYLATGRRDFAALDQDLIYSIGLIDYFADRFVVQLLNVIHAALRAGGRVVLGNFHTGNPDKAVMDHVLDWKLIHRTEDDMNRLFAASAFGRPCSSIVYEPQGINLFAECIKA
jgi:SAM-dependent methyltransferase